MSTTMKARPPTLQIFCPKYCFPKTEEGSLSLLPSTMQIRDVFVVDKRGSHFSREDNRGTSDQKKMFSTTFSFLEGGSVMRQKNGANNSKGKNIKCKKGVSLKPERTRS